MKILIGYSMRSGSTLLQHILGQHSQIRAYSDASSLPVLLRMAVGIPIRGNICVKPLDVFFGRSLTFAWLQRRFDKFIWIARDPRDSYLSSVETWIAYTFWRRGKKVEGIDTGLLNRWKRIYRNYFDYQHQWHLVHYEDLVTSPDETIHGILTYLGLPTEQLLPFSKASMLQGGDFKIWKTNNVHQKSIGRYEDRLNDVQLTVFDKILGEETQALGYTRPAARR